MAVEKDPFAPKPDYTDEPVKDKASPNVVGFDPVFTGEVGLSVKFGTGYEVPMFHVKADNVYTLAALVGYDYDETKSTRQVLAGLTDYWTNVARIVQNNYKASKPAADESAEIPKERPRFSTSSNRTTSRPAPKRRDDDADTDWMYDRETPPECEHGEKTPVTNIGKNGKRYFAWGCPGSRDDQCERGLQFVTK